MANKNSLMFTVSVNYDDPRWSEVKGEDFVSVEPPITDYVFWPAYHGQACVVMEYIVFVIEPTGREVLDEMKRRGLRAPDRAETETFLDKFPDEQKKFPIVSLCGTKVGGPEPDRTYDITCICAREGGRYLDFYWRDHCRGSDYRHFLAVRK